LICGNCKKDVGQKNWEKRGEEESLGFMGRKKVKAFLRDYIYFCGEDCKEEYKWKRFWIWATERINRDENVDVEKYWENNGEDK